MQLVEILWPAFVLALLLVFIHSIFGLEIIRRGVIFTDLAIGQIASIGLAISITFFNGEYQTPLTLLFALSAGFIISYACRHIKYVEAFIGLIYALGISSIMLILAQSSEGMELFNKLSAADILFSSSADVLKAFLLYGAIAGVMFLIYPKTSGIIKESIFFGSLSLTVTSSVQSAGVLVVFALLIAPAYAALVQKRFSAILFSWIVGAVAIVLALILSYIFDLPTGYTIIAIITIISLSIVLLLGKNNPD